MSSFLALSNVPLIISFFFGRQHVMPSFVCACVLRLSAAQRVLGPRPKKILERVTFLFDLNRVPQEVEVEVDLDLLHTP